MVLERILLEFDVRHKFEFDFNDAYKLHNYLTMVGKITSYAFLIQDEFHKSYDDIEKLKEYHDRIMKSELDFDYSHIVEFIDRIKDEVNDEKINTFILNNIFWA